MTATDQANAIADRWFNEALRLRLVIANAPHEPFCLAGKLAIAKCTCWKADAL